MNHAAVWIDGDEAQIYRVDAESFIGPTVQPPERRLRRSPANDAHEDLAGAEDFYHQVVSALAHADEVLVLGPAVDKLEFVRHVDRHDEELAPRIVGVETVDQPTSRQFTSWVRRYFSAAHPSH